MFGNKIKKAIKNSTINNQGLKKTHNTSSF